MIEERPVRHPQSRLILIIAICVGIASFVDSIHFCKYLGSAILVLAFIANASKQDDLSKEENQKWWVGLFLLFAYGWSMAVLSNRRETADLHMHCEQLREYIFPLCTTAFFCWHSKQSKKGTLVCILGAIGLIAIHAGEVINVALMGASVYIAYLAFESVLNLYFNNPNSKMPIVFFWTGLALITYPF